MSEKIYAKILDWLKKEDFEVQDGVCKHVNIIRNIDNVKDCLVVFIHSSNEKYENMLIEIYNYYLKNLSGNDDNIRINNGLIIDSLKIIDDSEIEENKKYKDIFKPYDFIIEIFIREFNNIIFGEYQKAEDYGRSYTHSYYYFKEISQNSKSEIFNDERMSPNIQTIKQRLINNDISLSGSSSANIWNYMFFDLYMANKESNKLLNNEEIGAIIRTGLEKVKDNFYVSFFIYFDIYFSQEKSSISSEYTDIYVKKLFEKEYATDPDNSSGTGKYLIILIQSIYEYKDNEKYGYNKGKNFSMKNIVDAVFNYISNTKTPRASNIEQSLFELTLNGFREIYNDDDEFVGYIVKEALGMGIKYVPTSLINLFKKYSNK